MKTKINIKTDNSVRKYYTLSYFLQKEKNGEDVSGVYEAPSGEWDGYLVIIDASNILYVENDYIEPIDWTCDWEEERIKPSDAIISITFSN